MSTRIRDAYGKNNKGLSKASHKCKIYLIQQSANGKKPNDYER